MKVRLIKDCWGPNPKFDPSKPKDEETNWPERIVPAGTVLEHPDAHYHCYGDEPNAEPWDDEARKIVRKNLERRARILAARAAQDGTMTLPGDVEPEAAPAVEEKSLAQVLPAKKATSP